MAIEDIISTFVLVGIVYAIVKWLRKPGSGTAPSESGIRGVTREMVDHVHGAFPDIAPANIIYSLSRTRSAQRTSEELLERGYLPAPPASFSIPSSLLPDQLTTSAPVSANTKPVAPKESQTLIDRFGLSAKLPSRKGKERDSGEAVQREAVEEHKSEWATTKERREQELRQRKERMILEARRRMLEKQAKEADPPSYVA